MIQVINRYHIIHALIFISNHTVVSIVSICICDDVVDQEVPPWSDWCHNNRALQDATGLDRSMYDYIYSTCREQLMEKRLHKYVAKDKVHHMSVNNMLVITLHWLRKNVSYHSLSYQYRTFSRQSITAAIHDVIDILDYHLIPLLIQPISTSAPSSRMSTLENVR